MAGSTGPANLTFCFSERGRLGQGKNLVTVPFSFLAGPGSWHTRERSVANHMHDTGLDLGFGEAFETVHGGDKDVLNAAVVDLGHDPQPEFGPSVCSIHRPRLIVSDQLDLS